MSVYDFNEGKNIYCNAVVKSILGYTPEQIQALEFGLQELVHPDDREGSTAIQQDFSALGENAVFNHTYRMRHADGNYRWLHCRDIVFERNADGTAKRLLGVARDITQEKHNEALLRDSEERFRVMADGSPFMIWVTDSAGRLQFTNYAFRAFFGITFDVIKGENWRSFVHPEDIEGFASSFRAALQRQEPWTCEARVRRHDGIWRWVSSYTSCRFSEAGDFLGCVGSSFDITDYKRAEAELQALTASLEEQVQARTKELEKSRQRFSAAFFGAPIAACLLNLDSGILLEVNDAFEELTGYPREEVIGNTDKALGLWSSQHDQQKLQKAISEGSFRDLELRIHTKDGIERLISSSARQIKDNGTYILLKMFYDITDQKRTEEQLLKAVQATVQDASWFSRRIIEKLAELKSEQPALGEITELTLREQQVLARMANGMTNEQIGEALNIKDQTVRNYISTIYEKINVHSRAQAVVWARERGLHHFEAET